MTSDNVRRVSSPNDGALGDLIPMLNAMMVAGRKAMEEANP